MDALRSCLFRYAGSCGQKERDKFKISWRPKFGNCWKSNDSREKTGGVCDRWQRNEHPKWHVTLVYHLSKDSKIYQGSCLIIGCCCCNLVFLLYHTPRNQSRYILFLAKMMKLTHLKNVNLVFFVKFSNK